MSQAGLMLRGVEHAYGPRVVVTGISLQVRPGRTVALVGPSGCGKTTLLRLCAGLLPVQAGALCNQFTHTVMLFQQPRLLPWKTIEDNIALGLKARGVAATTRLRSARDMGAALGLDALSMAQYPHQLSGGMQSRAALARALVLAPDLLLLDEPFSALDVGLKASMHQLVIEQQRTRSLGVLLITHDLMEAMTLADTVLVMATDPGRLVYRVELTVPAARRGVGWAHQQTATLLSQPVVRQAFGLPALVSEASMPADQVAGGSVGATLASTPASQEPRKC